MSKKKKVLIIILFILLACFIAGVIYCYFGGFGTGKCANVDEMKRYSQKVEDLTIPDEAKVIALGEATHGNKEFQVLKKRVFQILVEKYNVRTFVVEADFGCCEKANRFIHGGEGTAEEAAASLGFTIYRTKEMADLLTYMQEYNSKAIIGEDLRLYGCDCQQMKESMAFLLEGCRAYRIDTAKLESLTNEEGWREDADQDSRIKALDDISAQLGQISGTEQIIQYANVLQQNIKLSEVVNDVWGDDGYTSRRDRMMADNILWVKTQEAQRGPERIFVSGHNGHIAAYKDTKDMGSLLGKELGEAYYTLGTDYYKTNCTLRSGSSGNFRAHTFYSHDMMAKAVKKAGLDEVLLNFEKVPKDSALWQEVNVYQNMGSLGERYSILNRLIPQSTRVFVLPTQIYDAVIFVTDATPTEILD